MFKKKKKQTIYEGCVNKYTVIILVIYRYVLTLRTFCEILQVFLKDSKIFEFSMN